MAENSIIERPVFRTAQFDLPILNGRDGKNRAIGVRPQIEAEDDVSAIKSWLIRFADSPRTLNNYRKEAERVWLWATQEMRKPLSSLTHEDMMRYREFLARPPASWVNAAKHPRAHEKWRPLAGPLSQASIRQAEIIINALFSWLVEAGYLAGNPLSLSRRRKVNAGKRVTRYLTKDQWRMVLDAVEQMTKDTPEQFAAHARARWVTRLIYITGMRISEVCENTMGGFEDRIGKDNRCRWFLTLIGKGDKVRTVPATLELMDELVTYRVGAGLPKYPVAGEATPLVLSQRSKNIKGIARSAMHIILKKVFALAESLARPEDAAKFRDASAHWLRHSRGSHLAMDGVKLNSIRELFGHTSLSTTSIYLHGEDDDMHDEIEKVATR